MYARRIKGKELTFDFAEGLLKDNLLIVDRETSSVWSQLHGKAVLGSMLGTPLEMIPSIQTSWRFWREKHPDTRVMISGGKEKPYLYRNRPVGTKPPSPRPTTHDTTALGLGLVVGGESIFFPLRELDGEPTPLHRDVGGTQVAVFYSRDGITAWAEDRRGTLLPGVMAYETAWKEFHPDSTTFRRAARPR